MRYFDVFSSNGYHSAFLTTFSFGAQAFEDIVLPRLWSAGCRNVHVIADEGMVNQEFAEIGPPRHAGTRYHIVKERRNGAFHPKIVLQLGRTKARVCIGSANLTAPGLAGNLELVSVVECEGSDDPAAPFVVAVLHYLQDCVRHPDSWFAEGLRRAVSKSPWLGNVPASEEFAHPEYGRTAFIHDQSDAAAVDQFVRFVGDDDIHKISIVSPYWDKELAALQHLSSRLRCPTVRVVIEPERQLFPRDAAVAFEGLTVHDVGVLKGSRNVHAKLVIAEGRVFDHVLSGSMNCSLSALMHFGGRPRNAEAGLYRRMPARTAINAMGIGPCFEMTLPLQSLPEFDEPPDSGPVAISILDGGTLMRSGTELAWNPPGGMPAMGSCVSVFGTGNRLVADKATFTESGANLLRAVLPTGVSEPCHGIIHFADGRQSAPVAICDLLVLSDAAREVARGRAANLVASLESFDGEDLQIVEILIDLESLSDSPGSGTQLLKRLRRPEETGAEEKPPEVLSYQQFIAGRNQGVGKRGVGPVGSFSDTYLSDVRRALNRIIGIVAGDQQGVLTIGEEAPTDLRPTEPADEDDAGGRFEDIPADAPKTSAEQKVRQSRTHTTQQLAAAVGRFTNRMHEERNNEIKIADLVHLRVLLQILLAFALPRNEAPSLHRVLPAYDRSNSDWPRLVGQVIQAVYARGDAPFATLQVPGDLQDVPEAVLECWASIVVGIRLALSIVEDEAKAGPISGPLKKFQGLTAMRIKEEISSNTMTQAAFEEFLDRFQTRFAHLESGK